MAEPVHASPAHDEHHHDQSFWRKYIFSTDHKVIGVQYSVTGLAFLFFGFVLMMVMRWNLAYPGEPIPFIGSLLGENRAPGGIMLPDFYNELGAMHGTIMVFLGVVPLAVGGFGNFVMPLQLGAPDMAFPRINMISYWCLFMGGVTMFASFFLPNGLMDRVVNTSFFIPEGLVVGGEVVDRSGGGSPLLWQHLFWFLAHPEVYVLILPAMGIVAEVIANNSRKPLWGYRSMVYSLIFLGFMSFIVWAHHMFITGMGSVMSTFFQTTTMIISIPSVIILSALFISLWGGSIRYNTAMLFALGFLPMFGIGGLTGLPLGLSAADIPLHDTYYVIGHFHYVVAPGTLFALFAGVYYWFPKVTGRKMNEFLGKLHFWPSLVFMNGVFFPMMIQGLNGVSRRLADGGITYDFAGEVADLNRMMSVSAWCLALAQIPFIINFFMSIRNGEKAGRNPWNSTTVEWLAPSPAPHGNFDQEIVVTRGPYEYSVPGSDKDYVPQAEPAST